MNLVNSEYEFEDETHITALVDINIRRAFLTMLRRRDNLNNQIDIRSESELTPSHADDEAPTEYSLAVEEVKEDWIDEIISVTRRVVSEKDADIIKSILEGYTMKEIGARYGVTASSIEGRKKKIVKKLRLYYEIDTPINKKRSKKIRGGVRSESAPRYKASVHSHTEAMSFLGIV